MNMSPFRIIAEGRRLNKFGNIRKDGCPSIKHAKRRLQLKQWEQDGHIKNLREEVKYALVAPNGFHMAYYIADFVYVHAGRTVVEDVKGLASAEYRLKKKMMKGLLNIDILET